MSKTSLPAMSLEEKLGQMLLVGFPAGEEGYRHVERATREFAAGNFLLFSRNIGTPEDLFDLTGRIEGLAAERLGIRPLIAVDQEGGIVARLRSGVTAIPGAMAQAAAVAGGRRSAVDIRALGRLCGQELAALGINWDLAPVADVNVNPANPVIGVRSYGDDPEKVAELASAFALGLADAGLLATGKHFPGHGDTEVDSHLGLPLVQHGLERLNRVELVPFRRLIEIGIASIMTSHIRFPAIEADALPATLSPRILSGLLREGLGFRGIITTDCLEMKAISDNFPDAALQAVKAGADILDISHTFELQKRSAEALARAVRSGEIAETRIDESVERILAAKARLPGRLPSWTEASNRIARADSLEFSRELSRDSLALLRGGKGLPPAPGAIYIDILPGGSRGAEDLAGPRSAAPKDAFPERVSAFLEAEGHGSIQAIALPPEPGEDEIASVLSRAAGRDVVMGLHLPQTHPAQLRLARALEGLAGRGGRAFSLVSMRSPYDLRLFPGTPGKPAPAFLCAFEYTAASARAVASYLAGSIPARGASPLGPPSLT